MINWWKRLRQGSLCKGDRSRQISANCSILVGTQKIPTWRGPLRGGERGIKPKEGQPSGDHYSIESRRSLLAGPESRFAADFYKAPFYKELHKTASPKLRYAPLVPVRKWPKNSKAFLLQSMQQGNLIPNLVLGSQYRQKLLKD